MSLRFLKLTLFFLTPILLLSQAILAGEDWRAVTPEELAMKTPKVEADADAEAIFWEVRVDDSDPYELGLKHYVRVKIFTERGRNDFSKHDITFMNGTRIKDVEARVTKPDGSVVFLKKEDVLEREIVKASGIKVKAKSFALPGLEVGSIVEYRYREIISDGSANMRLVFQREIPVETATFYVRAFNGDRALYYQPFNTKATWEKDKNDFKKTTMTNVPALREEPNMLPEDQVRSWMYIYYSSGSLPKPEEYWKNISNSFFDASKSSLKVNDDVKKVTAEAITGASTDEEKLKKIYDYCKTQIKNLSYAAGVTEDDWKKVQNSKNPGDTLKLKMGSPSDIDYLFGAMARAAGFDARLAFSGDRSELLFDPNIPIWRLMLNSSSIAVKVGDQWQFYSPASYYAPFGMLSWTEESQTALITDSKQSIWATIPLAPANKSKEKRTGKFKLLEDGTLVGEAKIEFTGHLGMYHKNYNDEDSQAVRETTLKDFIKRNILSSAEVEDYTIQNVTDPEKPFIYTFKIRVPGYASRTGKRLFFQPNVFERSSKPRFSSSTRKYDIYMNYPWSEEDDITIELPTGFDLESPDVPAPIEDKNQGIFSQKINIAITNDHKTLIYKRAFSFGNNGYLMFPVTSYGQLKTLFDAFNSNDVHQLTLRQGDAPKPN